VVGDDGGRIVGVWLEDVETRRGLEGETEILEQAQLDL